MGIPRVTIVGHDAMAAVTAQCVTQLAANGHRTGTNGGTDARKTKGLAATTLITLVLTGAAGRIRTHDPLVRSQVLYPTELQPRGRAV